MTGQADAETTGFCLFETAIGVCALAWGESGIVGTQLPEGDAAGARSRLTRRFPQARETPPPPEIRAVTRDIVALLAGQPKDLSRVALDMAGVPAFNRRVYGITREIPPGATLTYGEVTARIGEGPESARAVGQALGQNPFPIVVPCHRVLAAGGKAGGFSADGGVATKLRMLSIERARTSSAPSLFDDLPLALAPISARKRSGKSSS